MAFNTLIHVQNKQESKQPNSKREDRKNIKQNDNFMTNAVPCSPANIRKLELSLARSHQPRVSDGNG